MAVFFDEPYARSIGLPARGLKVLFFALLAASTVAALQTVGAFLVIAMVVTPGRHRLPADRPLRPALRARAPPSARPRRWPAPTRATSSTARPAASSSCCRRCVFLVALVFAPKHGMLAARRRGREALR